MNSHRFHKVFTRSWSKAYLNHIALNRQLIGCQRLHNSVVCSPAPDNISQCFARSNISQTQSRVLHDLTEVINTIDREFFKTWTGVTNLFLSIAVIWRKLTKRIDQSHRAEYLDIINYSSALKREI